MTSKTKPKIDFSDASYKAWVAAGNDAEEFKGFDFLLSHVLNFIARVDVTHGPLKQKIHAMYRIRAPEYDKNGEPLDHIKEYVYYTVEYSGKDAWKQKRPHQQQ